MIASTIVTVLPVPGGPNTTYGAFPDVAFNIFITASCCSLFSLIFSLTYLKVADMYMKVSHILYIY